MEDGFTPSAEIQKILLSTGDAVMFNSSRRAIVHRAIAAAAGARTVAVIDFNSLLPGTLDLGVPEDLYLGYD